MNLISCYQSSPFSAQIEQRNLIFDVFRGKISEKLFYKIYEEFGISNVNFVNPEIQFESRLKYSIVSIENQDIIEFSVMLDSVISGFDFWFEVVLDICKSTIKITCKLMKNGLPLKAEQPGLIQMLLSFSMQYFPLYSSKDQCLRVNPNDGTVKYSSFNFLTKKDFQEKLAHPAYLCEEINRKISQMKEIMDKHLLGRILQIYNEIPLSNIISSDQESPKSLNVLYNDNEVLRVSRIITQCRKISEYIKTSDINPIALQVMLMRQQTHYPLTERQIQNDCSIRFSPQMKYGSENSRVIDYHLKRKKNWRHLNPQLSPFCKMLSNHAEKNLNPGILCLKAEHVKKVEKKKTEKQKDQNNPENYSKKIQIIKKEQYLKLRKLLAVKPFNTGLSNFYPLYIWQIKQERPYRKGFGGQITILKCVYNARQEMDSYWSELQKFNRGQTPIAPQEPQKKQTHILKKYEDPQKLNGRLFRQNSVISLFQNSSCFFVHRYFKCSFAPEAGVDQTYQQDSLFMEYRNDSTLTNFIQAYSKFFSVTTKLNLVFQILMGLRYLADKGIYHLDIKPDNILVRIGKPVTQVDRGYYMVKLIDFGQSCVKTGVGLRKPDRGITIPYASYEQMEAPPTTDDKFSEFFEKSDIYAMGVIILSLFFDLNTTDIKNLKMCDIGTKEWRSFYSICVEKCRYYGSQSHMLVLLELAYRCLDKEKKTRPTLEWMVIVVKYLSLSLLNYHYPKLAGTDQ